MEKRLHIIPGKIVNVNDPVAGMVDDYPTKAPDSDPITNVYGGKWQYHTTATVHFDALQPGVPNYGNEYLLVNDKKVSVLDYKFDYKMEDYRTENNDLNANNLYKIEVVHEYNGKSQKYNIDYEINNLVPELGIQWYAWDPDLNPDQNNLITPNLPDGQPNPKYDNEINPETGTKSQIV